jgi:uncharacterized protein Yka (UPF0111/DUF47 family)
VRFRLIPKEEKFFEDFNALADRIVSGATLLERMLASDPPDWDTALQIKQIEHECDALTHDIIKRLNSTFVTPIDREDIHALALALDDVMDAIDDCAGLLQLYRLDEVRPGIRELARILTQQAEQLVKAMEDVQEVHVSEAFLEHTVEIVNRTRKHPKLELGCSPRAGISLVKASRARALIHGRDYVLPEDLFALAEDVILHRTRLSYEAVAEGWTSQQVLQEILGEVAR